MSGTDMNTQQRFFNQSWHYAIVLNPHKQIWKAFVGIKAMDCQGFFLKDKDNSDLVEELKTSTKQEKSFSKKKDKVILLLIIALVSTIGFDFFKNRKTVANKGIFQDEVKTNQSTAKRIILFSIVGDTIDIDTSLQFNFSKSNELDFDNKLFVKKKNITYNSDSTEVRILFQLYKKGSNYYEFGTLRDTLNISSKKIQADSSEWVGFNFKGLINTKDE